MLAKQKPLGFFLPHLHIICYKSLGTWTHFTHTHPVIISKMSFYPNNFYSHYQLLPFFLAFTKLLSHFSIIFPIFFPKYKLKYNKTSLKKRLNMWFCCTGEQFFTNPFILIRFPCFLFVGILVWVFHASRVCSLFSLLQFNFNCNLYSCFFFLVIFRSFLIFVVLGDTQRLASVKRCLICLFVVQFSM